MIGMPEKTRKVPPKPPVPEIFIQNNPPIVLSDQIYLEAKDVICKDDQRVGYQHDGGYNVCLSPPMKLKKPCVRKIDYVKFDIEYNEWAVLQAIFEEGSLESVKQLGFEIHINEYFRIHKLNFRTTKEDFIFMYKTLEILKKLNFRKFNYRLNPFGEYKSKVTGKTRSHSYELFYINMNLVPSNYTVK
ncbi:hypothetical protein KUTeg_013183, partial [Tegillarca granosa]